MSGRALALTMIALTCAFALTLPALGSPSRPAADSKTLARAQVIRAELNARYGSLPGRSLAVAEASSTSVVESFTLLSSNLQESRTVAAGNGVWYAICPARATCPYPAPRHGRPASAYLPRRLALELAVRTFLETSASVVAVSLPTPGFFTLFVVERNELTGDTDLLPLARAPRQMNASASWPRATVDRVTRPRVFVFLSMDTTRSGRETITAIPRWPQLDPEP
jgi:hypothetical protein